MMPDNQFELGRGSIYLPSARSGVPWMLEPNDPVVQQHAERQAAGPETAADYQDYVQDAKALKQLLRHRHIAVVLDPDKAHVTDDIADRWIRYLTTEKPSTLAACAGSLGHDLGEALNDAHLHIRHGRRPVQSKDTLGPDPGPAWETSTVHNVRAIRIRTLDGSDNADPVLLAGAAGHVEDFTFRDMIVDLRGNRGGDDSYITTWFAPHVRASWTSPCREQGMTLSSSGSSIVYWNYAAWSRLNHHTLPEAFTAANLRPHQEDRLVVTTSTPTSEPMLATVAASVAAEDTTWRGRMIVVIDGGTGSSAESAALLLRNAFSAVVVGSASYGVIDFGNSTPYYLPVSGMEIHLPAQANDWGTPIDFAGIQPDVPLPAVTSLPHIAMNFDHIYRTGSLK